MRLRAVFLVFVSYTLCLEPNAVLKNALGHYSSRLAAEPDNAQVFTELTRVLRFSGQYETALEYMREGMDRGLFSTSEEYYQLAGLLRRGGRFREAINVYDRGLLLEPNQTRCRFRLQLALTIIWGLGVKEEKTGACACIRCTTSRTTRTRAARFHRNCFARARSAQLCLHMWGDHFSLLTKETANYAIGLLDTVKEHSIRYDATWNQAQLGLVQVMLALNRERQAIDLYREIHVDSTAGFLFTLPSLGLRVSSAAWRSFQQEHQTKFSSESALLSPEEATRQLASELNLLQGREVGKDCSSQRAVVFEFGDCIYGLGAAMHLATLVLSFAYQQRRMFVFRRQDTWWYTDAADCHGGGFTCYFNPIASCDDLSLGGGTFRSVDVEDSEDQRVLFADQKGQHFLKTSSFKQWVPPSYSHLGLLWWRAQLLAYLFRPNKRSLAVAHDLAARARWPASSPLWTPPFGASEQRRPYNSNTLVGLHVRRGDKIQEEAPLIDFDTLVNGVHRVSRTVKASVFLSTDEPAVLQRLHRYPELTFLFDPEEDRNTVCSFSLVRQTHALNVTRFALEAIANLILLSSCDSFVGSYTSNFSRLAAELMYARLGSSAPTYSVDSPWIADP